MMAKALQHRATAQLTGLAATGPRGDPALPSRAGYASPSGQG